MRLSEGSPRLKDLLVRQGESIPLFTALNTHHRASFDSWAVRHIALQQPVGVVVEGALSHGHGGASAGSADVAAVLMVDSDGEDVGI